MHPKMTVHKILIVDDVPANLKILSDLLEPCGYHILVAPSGEVALKVAAQMQPDLILLDVLMPGLDGFETCRRLKADAATADIPVIFVTAKGEIESLVEGFRVGGLDYIPKPFEEEEVLARVSTHLKNVQLTKALVEKNRELQQEITRRERAEDALQTADEQLSMISEREAERWGIAGFVGGSETIRKILGDIRCLQTTGKTTVLITGESGTGKELIARAIHFGGPRAKGPFITVNCSAIPSELAESSFFGHIRGAFTGAATDRKGYFELADDGTLFLDEIGDMPPGLQAKLLRVIEDGCFIPVGGTHEKRVDVRILAATNAHLQDRIEAGDFREDLYFRLTGFTVTAPPLRERPGDIPLLVEHFLKVFAQEMGVSQRQGDMETMGEEESSPLPPDHSPRIPALNREALTAVKTYHFPGNVRELKNIIERALIECRGGDIRPEHLHFIHVHTTPLTTSVEKADRDALTQDLVSGNISYSEAVTIFQRHALMQVLATCGGDRAEAARRLQIHRPNLNRLLKRLKLDRHKTTG